LAPPRLEVEALSERSNGTIFVPGGPPTRIPRVASAGTQRLHSRSRSKLPRTIGGKSGTTAPRLTPSQDDGIVEHIATA